MESLVSWIVAFLRKFSNEPRNSKVAFTAATQSALIPSPAATDSNSAALDKVECLPLSNIREISPKRRSRRSFPHAIQRTTPAEKNLPNIPAANYRKQDKTRSAQSSISNSSPTSVPHQVLRPEVNDENAWPRLLDKKLRTMILKHKQMPTRGNFEHLALRSFGFPTMTESTRNRLKKEIQKIYGKYRDLSIQGLTSEEITSKTRDAITNTRNRKYVDGSF